MGRRGRRPLRTVTDSAVGRADVGIGPYGSVTRGAAKWAVGDAGPYGSITRGAAKRAVGDAGPYESVTRRCGAGKNPPVTASPCQPSLGKGAEGTGMRIATASLRTGLAMTWFIMGESHLVGGRLMPVGGGNACIRSCW